jgi:hypothetical protein
MLMDKSCKRIPAILAYSRFLLLEPDGVRAQTALSTLVKMLGENVKQSDDKTISVFLDPKPLGRDSTKDNFRLVDMILSLSTALSLGEKYKQNNEVERFVLLFKAICAGLKEQRSNNAGFFWEHYAPFFIDMHERKYIDTFAYMIFYYNRDDAYIDEWVKGHQDKIRKVQEWSSEFAWEK